VIEVTDEMAEAFERAFGFASSEDQVVIHRRANCAGLAAVLAIVERDHQVVALCCEELTPGLRCTRALIPANGHRGDHEAKLSTGNTVRWS
jgi:hypothetical protein